MEKNKLIIPALLLVAASAFSQPDCRSIIGAHYTGIGNTGLSWAFEGAFNGGLMNDRAFANTNTYFGSRYILKNHQLHFEGAYKNWITSAKNPDGKEREESMEDYTKPTPQNWGFREMYYSFSNKESGIKLGIQSLKSKDYLLIDERMLGLSASQTFGSINIEASLGSVNQGIARFQDVCGNRHVYNIIHRSRFNFVSDTLGQSNFGAIFLTWYPVKKKAKASTQNKDLDNANQHAFESFEEFDSFDSFDDTADEFSSPQKEHRKIIKLDEAGLFFYEEFGQAFHEYKYYSGWYSTISLFQNFETRIEFIDQYIYNDHAIAWLIEMEKIFPWHNGMTSIANLGYLGKVNIDKDAHFYPAFTNLFKGEVMRLDAIDLPLVYGSVKHNFPGKLKFSTELKTVAQVRGSKSKEADLVLDYKPWNNIRLTYIGSLISSDLLDENYWMFKVELRIAI